MKPLDVGQFLVVDPRICHGQSTFKGTRIPVQTVLTFLTKGQSVTDILASWLYRRQEAIEEGVRLAAVAWPEMIREHEAEILQRLASTFAGRHGPSISEFNLEFSR